MAFTTSSFPDFSETQPDNPFADFLFSGRSSKEAADLLNGNAHKLKEGELEALLASGEFEKHERFIFVDKDDDQQKDTNEQKKYDVIIYYGKDAIKLKQIYESVVPGKNELLVFIENQTGDIFSDRKIYITMGEDVHTRFKNDITESDIVATSVFRAIGVANVGEHVVKIIQAGFGEVNTLADVGILFGLAVDEALETATALSNSLLSIPIDFLAGISGGLRSLEFKPQDWDPLSATNKKAFVPYFFPLIKFRPDGKAYVNIKGPEIAIDDLLKAVTDKTDALFNGLNKKADTMYKSFIENLESIGMGLIDFGNPEHSPFYDFIDGLRKAVNNAIDFLVDFAIDGILFYNALICGLVNSLIEIIAGIFDLIRLIFMGMKASNQVLGEATMWMEYLDNFAQALAKINFIEVLVRMSMFLNDVVENIGSAIWDYFGSLTSADIGYFIGFIIGFIIEQVLSAIFTAGIGNIASIARRAGQGFKVIMDAIFEVVSAAARKAGYDLLKVGGNFLSMIADFIRFLGKGTENLLKFMDEIWDAFKRWLDDISVPKSRRGKAWNEKLLKTRKQLSERLTQKTKKGKKLAQKIKDLDQLYKAAKVANAELETMTIAFAKKTKGRPGIRPKSTNGGLKSRERALEKIQADYGGDASKLVDIAGSKVVYTRLESLYDALEKFDKQFTILKFKDRIQDPLPSGYRDILMNVRMKNGHVVEFRLHLSEMDKAAGTGGGHDLYTKRRSIEALEETRELTVDERKEIKELTLQEQALYKEAWEKIINN